MNNSETDVLSLFAIEREGEDQLSDHTPRTKEMGDTSTASDAGEQANKLREEEFRALMEGEYKELFTAYFQQTFNRRFKEYKQIKAELDDSRAVLSVLHERFGDLTGDALLNAIRAETVSENAPTEAQTPPPELSKDTPVQSKSEEIEIACAQAQQRLLESIRARGMRPLENGLSNRICGASTRIATTRAERAEMARRAANGERIIL